MEEEGRWPQGLLDAHIAMIPKDDGDAVPLGQRPLCVLPVVYRLWASVRMCHLEEWFHSWVPDSVYSAGGGAAPLKLGILLRWISKKFCRARLMEIFVFFCCC